MNIKVVDLENELKMIGENMKSLEVAEEKALTREEKYQVQLFHNLVRRIVLVSD
jgi:hypothetical protein